MAASLPLRTPQAVLRRLTHFELRKPLYDPWHGANPVFLHEFHVVRLAMYRRQSGCWRP